MIWYQVAGLAFLAQLVIVGLFGMYAIWRAAGNKVAIILLTAMVGIALVAGCAAKIGLRVVVG